MSGRGSDSKVNYFYTKKLYELFPRAVESGIDAREVWFYSINELELTITVYKNRLSMKAMFDYKLADLIGVSVNRLLDKNAKFPTFEQAYPGLDTQSPEEKKSNELNRQKAWLMQYASAHNAKHEEV